MLSSYDIWKTSEPPYFEVVVVCQECAGTVADCECVECEDCENLESNCICETEEDPNDC